MKKRANQCRFCPSCSCGYRIVAAGFDEIACRDHVAELERFAEAELPPGWARYHFSTMRRMSRLQPLPLDDHRDVPVTFPARAAFTATPKLTRTERDVLRHCLGVHRDNKHDEFSPRNYFAAGGDDVAVWDGLVGRGLASRSSAPVSDLRPFPIYRATREGAVLVGAQLDAFERTP